MARICLFKLCKILTFYNFRLACHNQTKLSLSLLSQAEGGVKLGKDFNTIKIIPLSSTFLDKKTLTDICHGSLASEILLEGEAVGVACVTSRAPGQSPVHTRARGKRTGIITMLFSNVFRPFKGKFQTKRSLYKKVGSVV